MSNYYWNYTLLPLRSSFHDEETNLSSFLSLLKTLLILHKMVIKKGTQWQDHTTKISGRTIKGPHLYQGVHAQLLGIFRLFL